MFGSPVFSEQNKGYSALDIALAEQFVGSSKSPLYYLVAAVSKALSLGHSFLPLARLSKDQSLALQFYLPKKTPSQWLKLLEQSSLPWVNLAQSGDCNGSCNSAVDNALLVIDKELNLYFAKYYVYESNLASCLNAIATRDSHKQKQLNPLTENELDFAALAQRIAFYFADNADLVDYQALAVALALLKPLSIISGGPGTGKTTTVLKLLALLIESSAKHLSIGLAAPTGKAAARLAESIKAGKARLQLEDSLKQQIPEQAQTIHRLIAAQQRAKTKLLGLDVLILDEASMLDLSLMQQVLSLLPSNCKLILLGDKDQLPAVELGNLMGDLCRPELLDSFSRETWRQLCLLLPNLQSLPDLVPALANAKPAGKTAQSNGQLDLLAGQENPFSESATMSNWADACIQLKLSYRFDASSGIGQLAQAVNQMRADRALAVLSAPEFDDVALLAKPAQSVCQALVKQAADLYTAYLQAENTEQAFAHFNRAQILVAVRQGPHGVERLNQAIEQELSRRNLIQLKAPFYRGLAVMISHNHYPLNLFNGDVGIFDYDSDGVLKCFFEQADGGLRAVAPALLPQFEPAYALTVHKSQGSEFDHVLLVLPDAPSPLLSKEMLYTGITRAKKALYLYATQSELELACANANRRYSALPQRLAELDLTG